MVEKTPAKRTLYSIKYGKQKIQFELRRRKAKRLTIDVHPDQTIVVKAPEDKSINEIKKRVEKRANWIAKQIQYFERFQPLQPPRRFVSGETHYYLGRQYRLKVIHSDEECVKLIGKYLMVFIQDVEDKERIKNLIDEWYLEHAKPLLLKHVDRSMERVKRFGINYPPIQIRVMKKRWGSCTPTKRVILNPELIKTPLQCIDYVITHELCHLKIPDHSNKFFLLLKKCMPDWERRKERLEKMQI